MRWRVVFGLLVALVALLVAPPIVAAEWTVKAIGPSKASRFIFTATDAVDSTQTLDATACGTVAFGYRDDTQGADTAGSAQILACERKDQAQGSCTLVETFTGDSSFETVNERPGYYHVNVTATPGTGAEAMVDAYCAESVGSGGSGAGAPEDQVVVVAEGETICNADCTSTSNTSCAADSAIERARLLGVTPTNRVEVQVHGLHQECVAINGADLSGLIFHVMPDGIIRPAVDSPADVAGGVIKVGNNGCDECLTNLTFLIDGLVQNDAWSAPEAALQIGPESDNTAANRHTWRGPVEVIVNGRIVGHHDGLQYRWVPQSGVTDVPPKIAISGSGEIISGFDAVAKKGRARDTIAGVKIRSISNYCETATETFLPAVTGTAVGGTADTLVLESADDYGIDGGYIRRVVTLSGSSCGTANACAGKKFSVETYTTADDTISFPNDACSTAVTTGCSYSISAVANYQRQSCRDVDWGEIVGNSQVTSIGGQWKQTCYHWGTAGAGSTSADDVVRIKDVDCRVDANDAAIFSISNAAPGIGGFYSNLSGVKQGYAYLEDFDIEINLNSDQGPTTSTVPVAPIGVGGAQESLGIFVDGGSLVVNNPADPELHTSAIALTSSIANPTTFGTVYTDINNTVGSYAGNARTYHIVTPNTLNVTGTPAGPDAISAIAASPGTLITGSSNAPIHVAFAGTIATGSLQQFKFRRGALATSFGCKCEGGAACALTAQIRECDADGESCASVGSVSPNANNAYFNTTTFSDGSFESTDVGEIFLSSVTTAPTQVFCDLYAID